MLKHPEEIRKFVGVTLVDEGDYSVAEIEVVTAGGVTKVLRLAHAPADALRNALTMEFDSMEPDTRRRSFMASLRRKRT